MKKIKIKINFTEIFLDIGAVDKFYFLMYQRTIWVSLSRNIQISSLFFTGTFKSGICTATTVVARKGKLLDSDPTLPQNF